MPKAPTSVYICQQCDYQSPKWLGQCPNCQAWNSFEETIARSSQRNASGVRADAGSSRSMGGEAD